MIDTYLHIAALKALEHAMKHGDVCQCQSLYETVRKANKSNGEALKTWFAKFSPLTARAGTWCMKPEWKTRFNLDGASKTPINVRIAGINYRNMLSKKAWAAYVERLPDAPYVELLPIYSACNEAIFSKIEGARNVAPNAREDIAAEFRRRAQVGDYFAWPQYYIISGTGIMNCLDAPEFGMFAAMGYRVGRIRGQSDEYRRYLLDFIVTGTLPALNGSDYMQKWSEPLSARRLRTMVESLTHFGHNAQSRRQDLRLAIKQWAHDLAYLKEYHRQIPVPVSARSRQRFNLIRNGRAVSV